MTMFSTLTRNEDVMANMIGRGNARRAARRVFGVLQDRRLNEQIMLCILDEVRLQIISYRCTVLISLVQVFGAMFPSTINPQA